MEALTPQSIVYGVVWYVVFLLSTTCHEAAHALVAKLGGDLTAYEGGQVSLDPVPHIRREPVGMVVIPILSSLWGGWPIGWASAPYDPYWAQRHPRRAALMSLAGPSANLSLAILAAILIRVGMVAGVFSPPMTVSMGEAVVVATDPNGVFVAPAFLLSAIFTLNLVLAFLNILPLPPLDGSGAITLLMGERTAIRWREIMRQPMLAMLGLLVVFQFFWTLFRPIGRLAINLLYPGLYGG